jgi:F-type H+-transporting ATPase subunit delta
MASEHALLEGAAGRYATALFDLAREQGSLDKVEGDLKALQVMLDDSRDLQRLVKSPVFSADDQFRALASVLGKAGIGGLTANFIGLIAKNRRLFMLPDMLKGFRALMARHRGEVEADVTSATPLSPAHLEQLRATLRGSVGKEVRLNARVDPSLLGGLVVKIASRMVDSSLKTRLNLLKTRMKEAR